MKFISSLLVAVNLSTVYASGEERARISGDKNRIEQEFWELWGQKGIHSWGDLTKWTDKVRYGYCSGYYRKVIGRRLPTLQVVPQIKTALITVKFQSPLSKQMGFYGRKIRSVQVIHCPMTILQLRNPNQKLEHVYDFYLTKKSKKDNCLLEILPQIDVRTFEGVRQIKTNYFLASEICWPLVKREKFGVPIRRTKSDSEEMYKNLPQRPELRKTQSGAKKEEVNVPEAVQPHGQEAVPENRVDDQPHEVEHTEEAAHENEEETEERLNRDENEAQESSHHGGEAEPKYQVNDLPHAVEQTKEPAHENEEGTEEHLNRNENEAPECSHQGGEAVPDNRIDDLPREVEQTEESTHENKKEIEKHVDRDENEVLESSRQDRHLDEHSSEESEHSHPGIAEDQQELYHEHQAESDEETTGSDHSNSNYFDQQMAPPSPTAVVTENATSEHNDDLMDRPATPTLPVEEKQNSAYNSDTEFHTPTSLMKGELKMDTEMTESIHNEDLLDKFGTPTSTMAEKHNSDNDPDSPMSTRAEKHSSDDEPDSLMSTMAQKHNSDNDPSSPIFFMGEKNSIDIESDFPTSLMEGELTIDIEKADSIHNDDCMDILVTATSPVGEKRNSEFGSDKQSGSLISPMGEKQIREHNSDDEPGTPKSPTEQNEVYIHTSGSEYASPTGENVEVETEKKGHWFPSQDEPHFSPDQFETYDDNTDEELDKKVHWSPTDNEPYFSPDEFGTYDDISYHELKNI